MSRRVQRDLEELRRVLEVHELPPRIRGVVAALLDGHATIAHGAHLASCNDLKAQGYLGAVSEARRSIQAALEEINRVG